MQEDSPPEHEEADDDVEPTLRVERDGAVPAKESTSPGEILIALGALGLISLAVLLLLRPAGRNESEKSGDSGDVAAAFPPSDDSAPAPAAPPPEASSSMLPSAPAASSLKFIRPSPSLNTPSARQPLPEGPPRRSVSGPDSSRPATLGSAALRQAMQGVVDYVHRRQPGWYQEFLARRDLKEIADRYDRTRDFGVFIEDLSRSAAFAAMVSSRAGRKEMRQLVAGLRKDKRAGPKLDSVFESVLAEPGGRQLARRFGRGILPAEMLTRAGSPSPRTSARVMSNLGDKSPRKPSRLRPLGKDGFIQKDDPER